MQNELKPCPFCGGKAIILQTDTSYRYSKYFATCNSCGAEMPRVCRTREEAIEVWNRRVDNAE